MKIIPLRQGSPAWLRWRRGGLGGSDAAAVLGVSPFEEQTPQLLYARLIGAAPPIEATYPMKRGLRLEPIIRTLFCRREGVHLAPLCGEHDAHPWMRTSLDGITLPGDMIAEFKAPNTRAHMTALQGAVPDYYWPQCQHNLAVSGAELCMYASYTEHKDFAGDDVLAVVPVGRDEDFIARLIRAEERFWHCVTSRTPPGTEYLQEVARA